MTINPVLGRVLAKACIELGQQIYGVRRRRNAWVVRSPADQAVRLRSLGKPEVRRIENDSSRLESGGEGLETRPFLPHVICRGIEVHRGPPARSFRRKSSAHMFPCEAGALCSTVIEQVTNAPLP